MILDKLYQDRIRRVIDDIKQHPASFNYNMWARDTNRQHTSIKDVVEHPCGTQFCIGGWAMVEQFKELFSFEELAQADFESLDYDSGSVYWQNGKVKSDTRLLPAARYIGLDYKYGEILFMGYWHPDNLAAPVEDVLAKLEEMATGEFTLEAEYL